VACSSTNIKVLPVADDESCGIKVNGSKPGTVTALNVGATLVRLEVKSPDRSNSEVYICLLPPPKKEAMFSLLFDYLSVSLMFIC